jgi:hypothetical protein
VEALSIVVQVDVTECVGILCALCFTEDDVLVLLG